MEYAHRDIEQKWQQYWKDKEVYKVSNNSDKPKFYVLDMFPYPSGAGLHVGHPLGYIASDILARYKRHSGYNVLHPMGYDAFGLPAEQYALETGQHPAVTTEQNIDRYRQQLDNIGFCYDWSREVRTSDPRYYKWTQWIFLQLFHSWYDRSQQKARPINELTAIFEQEGNTNHPCPEGETLDFDAAHWKGMKPAAQRHILMQYRLAYLSHAEVWWCEALGTVLANDEVVNGVSERGGHPVVKKKMNQWFLRITEYAERLLSSLDKLDWTDAMKEMQRNWIGKSTGAEVTFNVNDSNSEIKVFTTRPDTIFGVDFMVLAPEHELVDSITTEAQKAEVEKYIEYVQSRSERERMAEVKQITGAFTGAYVTHPFTGNDVPVWISEYVLAGYGTGAIMAVPSGDERDHAFAKHFNISITNVFGDKYNGEEAYSDKGGTIENSDFLSGKPVSEAIAAAIKAIVEKGIGQAKVNYKLRDAGFSRQRYWGEPFPVIYKEGVPYTSDELGNEELPLELPHVDSYKPGPEGQGPLANIADWVNTPDGKRETNTMPGYAGSSWYFLRYMDPHNDATFADRKATDYWQAVDIYIGGTEHAVGHLLYSRMWTKALHDLGHIGFDEPFKKLINQGMIQGSSRFVYRIHGTNKFVSYGLRGDHKTDKLHADVSMVDGNVLDTEAFKKWKPEYADAEFVLEDGKYICGSETEKMSKSKYNVVNPDDIVAQYGADTFRMYEMFLGPIDVSKPWDTKGIEGVHRFLKKMWRLYNDEQQGWIVTDEAATDAELKVLHKTIKKISEDIERFSFNTSVSQFMIAVNELSSLNCHKKAILEPLAVVIAPFAPHFAEELWHSFGHETSVVDASYPQYEEKYVKENSKNYPVAINGKARAEMEFPLDMDISEIEKLVLSNETVIKWMEGKTLKKFIYVPGRMINVVV
ncbi:MAG: leucine--tRNA ligase [Chitinophagales bacterium]|nr:leucine--tRNA ligase [Chitinophagales bacterium]